MDLLRWPVSWVFLQAIERGDKLEVKAKEDAERMQQRLEHLVRLVFRSIEKRSKKWKIFPEFYDQFKPNVR